MPKGPQGQKRPADAIGLAVLVGKIATGETKEELLQKDASKSRGGRARAEKLTAEQRSKIAQGAATKRWLKE